MFRNSLFSNGGFLAIEAIQSPDFLTGVRGWQIRKDGSVEFNSANVRGRVIVGTLTGPHIEIDSNGSVSAWIKLYTGSARESTPALIESFDVNPAVATEELQLDVASPALNVVGHTATAHLVLISENADGSLPARAALTYSGNLSSQALLVEMFTPSSARVTITGNQVISGTLTGSSIAGALSISFVALTSFTVAVTFPVAFSTVPAVTTAIASGAGNTARWGSRPFNITTTGFTLFLFVMEVGAPAQTWTNVPVKWIAIGT